MLLKIQQKGKIMQFSPLGSINLKILKRPELKMTLRVPSIRKFPWACDFYSRCWNPWKRNQAFIKGTYLSQLTIFRSSLSAIHICVLPKIECF